MPYLNDVMHFQHLIVLLLGRCSFLLQNFIILYKFEYIDWIRFPCSSKNRIFQAAAYCDFENHELNDYRPLLPSTVKMNGCISIQCGLILKKADTCWKKTPAHFA